jgi:mannose-6-phosphate isomerase-like protein (cupin superfamily)
VDGYWFVLGGRARFYTTGDELLAELGRHEGILIPRGFPYWFESAGQQDLELLQVEAFDISIRSEAEERADRIDLSPRKASYIEGPLKPRP